MSKPVKIIVKNWYLMLYCLSRVTVRCSYIQMGTVPLAVTVNTLPPPLPVSTSGPLELEMRIAKGETMVNLKKKKIVAQNAMSKPTCC